MLGKKKFLFSSSIFTRLFQQTFLCGNKPTTNMKQLTLRVCCTEHKLWLGRIVWLSTIFRVDSIFLIIYNNFLSFLSVMKVRVNIICDLKWVSQRKMSSLRNQAFTLFFTFLFPSYFGIIVKLVKLNV